MGLLENSLVSLENLAFLGTGFCLGVIISFFLARSYGLFFSGQMKELSNQALPQIVQGSRLTGLVSQFLYQTQRLSSAETGPDRRIAYERIQGQFDQIRELVASKEFSDKHLDKQLIVLETTLAELDELRFLHQKINQDNRQGG